MCIDRSMVRVLIEVWYVYMYSTMVRSILVKTTNEHYVKFFSSNVFSFGFKFNRTNRISIRSSRLKPKPVIKYVAQIYKNKSLSTTLA